MPGEGADFPRGGDDLPADGVLGIIGINQGDIIGGDIHAEEPRAGERLALAVGELEDFSKSSTVFRRWRKLPAPVVPFFIGNILESRGSFGRKRVGHEYSFRGQSMIQQGILNNRKIILAKRPDYHQELGMT